MFDYLLLFNFMILVFLPPTFLIFDVLKATKKICFIFYFLNSFDSTDNDNDMPKIDNLQREKN